MRSKKEEKCSYWVAIKSSKKEEKDSYWVAIYLFPILNDLFPI